jgi:hypothetical protein
MRAFDDFFGVAASALPDRADRARLPRRADRRRRQPFFIAQNDVRTGFIGGTIGPHYLNPDLLVLSELFWWVVPAFRGSIGRRPTVDRVRGVRAAPRRAPDLHDAREADDRRRVDRSASLIARGYIEKERAYLLELPRVAA